MDNKYSYSIIIPHKDIPQLLQRCLDSIPVRDDVEIIIVDDNSSPQVVDFNHFPGKDRPNATVIFDKSGKGAGRARNVGIDHAKGKWLIFADADDFFCDEFNEILDRFFTDEADVLYFKHRSVLSNNINIETDRFYESNKIISDTSLSIEERETFIRCRHNCPVAKFVKRNVVVENNLRYEECKYANDVVFNITLGCIAKKIRLIDEVLYVMTDRDGSLTSRKCAGMDELYMRTKAHIRQQAIIERHGYMGLFAPALWFIPILYRRDLRFFMKALKFSRNEGLSMLSLYKGMIKGRSIKSRIKVLFFFLLSYFYLEF